jgi:bifunctional UDP-N-acetylglucosamine pyrophosphorylase/glucosamine-1-phosphate N-acetyltransferase
VTLHVVILAAGQGTRMRSALPKVLHPVAGTPMVERVVRAAAGLGADSVDVVVGPANGPAIRAALASHAVRFPVQQEQLGTGHAVREALHGLPRSGRLLVLFADGPLVRPETLLDLLAAVGQDEVGLLTARFDDPTGFGRILRDAAGAVTGIVEQKDADAAQRAIDEINTGIMVLPLARLHDWLGALGADNAQGEYYLTDVIAMAADEGVPVRGRIAADPDEVLGVNDRVQLARAERILQRRIARELMASGVTVADPDRLDVRGTLRAGRDCFIDVGAVFEGEVTLGDGVRVGPHCCVRDAEIGAGTEVHAHSVIDGARVGPACSVGPFARLRPGTVLDDGVRIGNFVETKKAHLGSGAKANHLAYLGDATIGADSNVGAGTITCNYDGFGKHRTVLGAGVFVGSNSTLVAPLTLGEGVFVAAGSTLTDDVGANALALGRARQREIVGWVHPARRDDDAHEEPGAGGR